MAVYERTYRSYTGGLAPAWSRFLVVSRHALGQIFDSRVFLAFFTLCFIWPLVCSVVIYLRYNTEALELLDIRELIPIDGSFFYSFVLQPQGWVAFALALVVGPALVSPDLRNNALPLYLARPFSRSEYVLGKLAVLGILLSAVTWVPGLCLFVLQGYLEGAGWMLANAWIAAGLLVASAIWILLLSLVALALSAWLKWKPLSRLSFLGVFFILEGLGGVMNLNLRTDWGTLIQLIQLRSIVWRDLLHRPIGVEVPVGMAWAMLLGVCLLCLGLLAWKVKAYEVVT